MMKSGRGEKDTMSRELTLTLLPAQEGSRPSLLSQLPRSMPAANLRPLSFILRPLYFQPALLHIPSRHSSTTSTPDLPSNGSVTEPLPARWLTDLKSRIGKCIMSGLREEQVDEAGDILKTLTRDWRELVAGSEGFLTGKGRAGFEGREVEWGEMVSGMTFGKIKIVENRTL